MTKRTPFAARRDRRRCLGSCLQLPRRGDEAGGRDEKWSGTSDVQVNGRRPLDWLVAWWPGLVTLCLGVSGCSDPGEAYIETQSSIQSTLTSEHLPVASVACAPHVGQLEWTDPPAHLRCVVHFKDGSSYTTPATVQPVVDQPDALTSERTAERPRDDRHHDRPASGTLLDDPGDERRVTVRRA